MLNKLWNWWLGHSPLNRLMMAGLFTRLAAAFFSKGFGWSDDHFLTIEAAQNWADGLDYYWLPSPDDPTRVPQGHPLLYVWFLYAVFKTLMFFGVSDPHLKMYFVRIIHALWSLLIIKYGYKILERYSDQRTALLGGWCLVFCWIFPFLSVRNLGEFVCVPPLLVATWLLVKTEKKSRDYLLAGLLLGLAFSLRFQSVLYSAGIGLAMLITRVSLKNIVLTLSSLLVLVCLTQGVVDYFIWKIPFGEFLSYVDYNLNNATNYGVDVWYMYPSLLLGLLIPPLSIAFFIGWIYGWKKLPFLFWPVFIFLAFHSSFPNKQERFITTVLPSYIIAGILGMKMLHDSGRFRPGRFAINSVKYFVVPLNMLLLAALTFSYSKRHRCEAMYYLYKKNDSVNFMIEDSNKENDFLLPPLFYYGKWPYNFGINKTYTADSALKYFNVQDERTRPSYVVFWQAENIGARVDSLRKRFPGLEYETTIQPSLIDKTLHWLNPLNDNHEAYIYRIKGAQ